MKAAAFLPSACLVALAAPAAAQWQATTFNLNGGWNAIYLHGDASHATPDVLFNTGPALNIVEIWRWNPNPTQVQFTTDPMIPAPGTPEWSTWYRNPAEGQTTTLTALTGPAAYLVKCTGTTASNYAVSLTQKPLPPSANWVRNGANLLGFPTNATGGFPTFSNYFTTFPAAIAANAKVFKYVGGDLGPTNPIQVFSPTFEPLNRNSAYWFEAEVVGNFYAPIEVSTSLPTGLDFGRTRSLATVRLRNRTSAVVTMTVDSLPSDPQPAGQPDVTAPAPLKRRIFDTGTNQYIEAAISWPINEVVAPQSSVEIVFAIDRGSMSANLTDLYASLLKITDSGNRMEVCLPVSAQPASLAGLWVADVGVTDVESLPSPGGTGVLRPFTLRYLMHVDDGGTARLLSQVFTGVLDASGEFGVCTIESALMQDHKATATRMVAAHMPLDLVLLPDSGSVELGETAEWIIAMPFNNKTSPFVHQYHPDHDNKDARLQPVGAGVESCTVSRAVSFDFAASPPPGTSATGWGTTILGGTYSETVTGAHRHAITASGTFTFRRVNDIGSITTP